MRWRISPRGRNSIWSLGNADPSALRIALADKLHNARQILADYRKEGDELETLLAQT